MTTVVCERCKLPFDAKPKELNRGKGRFCGVSCANAYRSSMRKNPQARKIWLEAAKATDRYKQQRAAHSLVSEAIRRGDLVRQPCEVCGGTIRVHAHHDDYSKPLLVRWLCVAHHRMLHG